MFVITLIITLICLMMGLHNMFFYNVLDATNALEYTTAINSITGYFLLAIFFLIATFILFILEKIKLPFK